MVTAAQQNRIKLIKNKIFSGTTDKYHHSSCKAAQHETASKSWIIQADMVCICFCRRERRPTCAWRHQRCAPERETRFHSPIRVDSQSSSAHQSRGHKMCGHLRLTRPSMFQFAPDLKHDTRNSNIYIPVSCDSCLGIRICIDPT